MCYTSFYLAGSTGQTLSTFPFSVAIQAVLVSHTLILCYCFIHLFCLPCCNNDTVCRTFQAFNNVCHVADDITDSSALSACYPRWDVMLPGPTCRVTVVSWVIHLADAITNRTLHILTTISFFLRFSLPKQICIFCKIIDLHLVADDCKTVIMTVRIPRHKYILQ